MNIDDLSQETLWKLYSFVNDGATDAFPDAANASAREKGNATDQVQACLLHELAACPDVSDGCISDAYGALHMVACGGAHLSGWLPSVTM